jgi:hypothetical protein
METDAEHWITTVGKKTIATMWWNSRKIFSASGYSDDLHQAEPRDLEKAVRKAAGRFSINEELND